MTTILGIKTNYKTKGIVLAADFQLSNYNGDNHTEKEEIFKIRTDKDKKSWAAAFCGTYNKYLEGFFSYLNGERDYQDYLKFVSERERITNPSLVELLGVIPSQELEEIQEKLIGEKLKKRIISKGSKKNHLSVESRRFLQLLLKNIANVDTDPVREAIRTGYFAEFNLLNRYNAQRSGNTELILTANDPHLELYTVDSYGNVTEIDPAEDLEYKALGTGAKIVEEYFDKGFYKEDSKIPPVVLDGIKVPQEIRSDKVTLSIAKSLAYGALKRAMKTDLDSSGTVDLVMITKEGVTHYGPKAKSELEEAEKEIYAEIINK